MRGSKRYGRRSTPEFIESVTEFSEVVSADATEEQGAEENDDTVPRKREVTVRLMNQTGGLHSCLKKRVLPLYKVLASALVHICSSQRTGT